MNIIRLGLIIFLGTTGSAVADDATESAIDSLSGSPVILHPAPDAGTVPKVDAKVGKTAPDTGAASKTGKTVRAPRPAPPRPLMPRETISLDEAVDLPSDI